MNYKAIRPLGIKQSGKIDIAIVLRWFSRLKDYRKEKEWRGLGTLTDSLVAFRNTRDRLSGTQAKTSWGALGSLGYLGLSRGPLGRGTFYRCIDIIRREVRDLIDCQEVPVLACQGGLLRHETRLSPF